MAKNKRDSGGTPAKKTNLLFVLYTAEAQVIACAAGFSFTTTACFITDTIGIAAEEGAAALHMFFYPRFIGIKTGFGAFGVDGGTAFIIVGLVQITAPFPYIAFHIVQAIAIGGERFHRGKGGIPIF